MSYNQPFVLIKTVTVICGIPGPETVRQFTPKELAGMYLDSNGLLTVDEFLEGLLGAKAHNVLVFAVLNQLHQLEQLK